MSAVLAPASETFLELSHVSVSYGGVVALDDVSAEIRLGDVAGLIGPNGAGKSTLFDVVSGMNKPDRGAVRLDGVNVTQRSARWRAKHGVGRTFQRQQVFGRLTVEDNLRVAVEGEGTPGGFVTDLLRIPMTRREVPEQVEEVVELCGLAPIRNRYAGSLPIGQARMVELGRALVARPRLLLLDEPTSGLDEGEKGRLGTIVRSLGASGCTVFLVEHDVGFVLDLCDRILMLDLGRVVTEGSPDEIRVDPEVRRAYLG